MSLFRCSTHWVPLLISVLALTDAQFFSSGSSDSSDTSFQTQSFIPSSLIDKIKAAKQQSSQSQLGPLFFSFDADRSARRIDASNDSNPPDDATTIDTVTDGQVTTVKPKFEESDLVRLQAVNPDRPAMTMSLTKNFTSLNDEAVGEIVEKAKAVAALNTEQFVSSRKRRKKTTTTTTTTTTSTTTSTTPTTTTTTATTTPATSTTDNSETDDDTTNATMTMTTPPPLPPKRNQKTAAQLAASENEGEKKSLVVGKQAAAVEELTKSLVAKFGIPLDQIASQLPLLEVSQAIKQDDCLTASEGSPKVPLDDPFSGDLPACASFKFRTFDGTCNNIAFPERGSSSTIFLRLLEPDYSDSISAPRKSKSLIDLPSARIISQRVGGNADIHSTTTTLMFMQFGQFINTPKARGLDKLPPTCCKDDVNATLDPACYPILIPKDDAFLSKSQQTCMEFVRSLAGTRPGCTLGRREQVNQNTAFIDGSAIYGLTRGKADSLRTKENGHMITFVPSNVNDSSYQLLPQNPKNAECIDPNEIKMCFKAGDVRVNVHLGIAEFQTLWLRQHNFVADNLRQINPHWGDEKLFQEARNIVAAQLQHITYAEFLPLLLGDQILDKFNLTLLKSGRFHGYNISMHPGIMNEFATAAYRVGHTMVPSAFKRMSSDYKFRGSENLKSTFFHPFALYDKDAFDEVILGMSASPMQEVDNNFVEELSNHLFEIPGDAFGLDLTALNVQRGRDHGLPGWMKWRQLCALPTASTFDELRAMKIIPETMIDHMELFYDDIADVDLYIAGTAENHVPGGQVGPTFACIIAEQFRRLKHGDRYWYENDLPLTSTLSDRQVDAIRTTTLAKILCDNTPLMDSVQLKVFLLPDPKTNPVVSCDDIPSPNLRRWKTKKAAADKKE